VPFGKFFSVNLGYLKLCLDKHLICTLVGGPLTTLRCVAVWKMVPLCLLWCLWKEQNDRSFEDREMTLEEIKARLVR
jgi:hypothetical protein